MKELIGLILVGLLGGAAYAADPVQLKIGREIFASYVTITGISEKDTELRELFRLNADRFPKRGVPEEMSNGVIMAATELGGAFCKKTITREMALPVGQRSLFTDVNFKRGPAQFGEFAMRQVINRLGMAFWQRDVTETEATSIVKVFVEAIDKKQDTSDETGRVLQIVCTTYATSLAFLAK